jgi:hypothetical protein
MKIEKMIPVIQATTFHAIPGYEALTVHHVVASDLMSDVLVAHAEDFILITSLASDQMIRTADLVGAIAIVLVNGKNPPPSVIKLAKDLNLPLLGTKLSKFEACLALGNALTQENTP